MFVDSTIKFTANITTFKAMKVMEKNCIFDHLVTVCSCCSVYYPLRTKTAIYTTYVGKLPSIINFFCFCIYLHVFRIDI